MSAWVNCDFCGKSREATAAEMKHHRFHFCNTDCRSHWQRNGKQPKWIDGGYRPAGVRKDTYIVRCKACNRILYRFDPTKAHFCNDGERRQWMFENGFVSVLQVPA